MKPWAALLLLLLPMQPAVASEDPRILDIRTEYQAIRTELPKLKKKEVYLDNYSADGGSGTLHSDSLGRPRFVRVELYGESGKAFEEYYFKDGKLIFVFIESHEYNVPYYVDEKTAKETGQPAFDPEKTKIEEDRYYFSAGKLVRWVDENKKQVDVNSKEAKEATKTIQAFVKEVLDLIIKGEAEPTNG